ncbi:MAG: hypothetical protein RKP46_02160 [Candidatus Accumulibacter sp.]|uniref:hypothetical protein n=1 Tax=Accumulibacter sp. TaxID=2053492 RepID=UPI002878A9BD|nr:hypothetical protein [Accumulibacter sp.]MDS4013142.1 hypothetical protein [Accumulibacter sp.]
MESAVSSGIDWGAAALFMFIGLALLWGFVFFLRQNRKDYESLQQTLASEEDEARE